MNDESQKNATSAVAPGSDAFGSLVHDETLRRALRKTPQQRMDMLTASLRDAKQRGLIPKRDRATHEKRLLWLIQRTSSAN